MAFNTQTVFNRLWGEKVTYTRAGVGSTHRLTACRYIQGEEDVVGSYGVYTVRREVYTIASDGIPFEPHLRDTITRAKETGARVVTEVGGSPFLKFWKLSTSYPTLYDQLDQTATVYRANAAPDSLGLRDTSETAAYSSVLCRLQPVEYERDLDAAAREVTRKRYRWISGTAVTLRAGDTVEVSSVRYEVTKQSEVESLGLLTFAEVERID